MMFIGVVGINHSVVDLTVRENVVRAWRELFFSNLFDATCVSLITCNREELYFSSHNMAETAQSIINTTMSLESKLLTSDFYVYYDSECFAHLAMVTAGLKSADFGETEIQGQVKIAYTNRSNETALPAILHFIFQKSLKIGKDIRRLFYNHKSVSLESVIYDTITEFTELNNRKILLVGYSSINKKVYSFLQKKDLNNLTFFSNFLRAYDVLDHNVNFCTKEDGIECTWNKYDVIIFGSKAEKLILTAQMALQSEKKFHLIIDLSVPRNVDSCISNIDGFMLFNIDHIHACLKRHYKAVDDNLIFLRQFVREKVDQQICIFNHNRSKCLAHD